MCVCVRACVRACVRVCVRVCVFTVVKHRLSNKSLFFTSKNKQNETKRKPRSIVVQRARQPAQEKQIISFVSFSAVLRADERTGKHHESESRVHFDVKQHGLSGNSVFFPLPPCLFLKRETLSSPLFVYLIAYTKALKQSDRKRPKGFDSNYRVRLQRRLTEEGGHLARVQHK